MNECSEIESILCNTTLNNIDHYDRDYRMIHNPPSLSWRPCNKRCVFSTALKIPQHLNPVHYTKESRKIYFIFGDLAFFWQSLTINRMK